MTKRAAFALDRRSLVTLGVLGLAILLAAQLPGRDRQVVVLFPPEGLADALPEGVRIISMAPMELTLAGSYGLTKALRDAGASIVLPAEKGGCKPRSLP